MAEFENPSPLSKRQSLLWPHFIRGDDDTAKCKTCETVLKTRQSNTSGMRKHLKSVHKDLYSEVEKSEKERDAARKADVEKNDKKRDLDDKLVKESKQAKLADFSVKFDSTQQHQEALDKAMVNMFARTFSPFHLAEQSGFIDVMRVANPKLKVKAPCTYSRMMDAAGKSVLSQVCIHI